jgi:two-component system response regulator YesN
MEPLRVMIADDEPKIRKGLMGAVDWAALGMAVVAEAEDGEIALEKALGLRPDLLLVDIRMPFLGGLELVDRLRTALPDCLVIVVTGHDEFAYAQQALRLNVFDFILKPVQRDQLQAVLRSAADALATARRKRDYLRWAERQLKKNMLQIRERFLNEWVQRKLSEEEVSAQLAFFAREMPPSPGMMLVRVALPVLAERDRQLHLFAVQNILEELCAPWQGVAFRDARDHIAVILALPPPQEWSALARGAQETIRKYLSLSIHVAQAVIRSGWEGVPEAYEALVGIMGEENRTPMVALCQAYIDDHYASETLSLQDVAGALGISPAYLSRLMRQELGASFIDYLIQVRMTKAAQLLRNPLHKVGDVAQMVGYSSQHYFSTAFKKKAGVSPAEYRREG